MRGIGIALYARLRRGVVALAFLAACGDNLSPPDASVVTGFVPAPHVPLPRVAQHSGTVLAQLQLVTITYADDARRAQLESFADAVLTSHWYTAIGAEYHVDHGVSLPAVHLDHSPASLSRDDIAAALTALATSHQAPTPPKDVPNQIVYALYVPSTVARAADLVTSYHATITVDGRALPFVVVLEDPLDFAATTVAAARVLINTATDPYPVPNDGFYADPPSTDPWSLVPAEIADLCDGDPAIALDTLHPQLFVPRVYSNAAAASGGTPCTPTSDDDTWNDVSADPTVLQPVPPGGSATFHLIGWSTRSMSDWTLSVERAERSALSFTAMSPELDSDTINNNRQATLTLHAPINALPGQVGGVSVVSGPNGHLWNVGIVVSE